MSTDPNQRPSAAGSSEAPADKVDPGQASLAGALRASFRVLQGLMLVLVAVYGLSGLFQVEQGQRGLVTRFGKLRVTQIEGRETTVFPPGWHATLPPPFDEKLRIDVRTQRYHVLTFLFALEKPEEIESKTLEELGRNRMAMQLDPARDGALFTGDRNLSHGVWTVEYEVANPELFVTNVASRVPEATDPPLPLLLRLTDSAVMREVAGRTVEEVTRRAVEAVADGVRRRLQAQLDELETGIRVVKVVARTTEPSAVREAFLNVTRAEQEAEQIKQQAREQANATLRTAAGDQAEELIALIKTYGDTQAQRAEPAVQEAARQQIYAALRQAQTRRSGQVAQLLNDAEQQANALVQVARSELERVQRLSELVAQNPSVALLDVWNRTREAVLENRRVEIFYIPQGTAIEILIPSDEQRKRQLGEELIRDRQRR
ncbi:MAG: hypothetical protein IPM18_07175 [Phycisphaerales bacterium]|nr:hypothetical protein [Phycisphaerales bacterium]